MGQAAARSAREASGWEKFRKGIVNAYMNILEPRRSAPSFFAEVLP